MSQKKVKRNKIKSPAQMEKESRNTKKLQGSSDTKKFDPLARNILYTDLIILALAQIMYSNGWIGETLSGFSTVVGVVLLIVALYIQFGPKKDKNK